MNLDKAKLAALGNAVAIIKGKKIPEGVQRVRVLAKEKADAERRADLTDRVAKAARAGARVGVDAGFRKRDKKTRPDPANRRTGQYDSENWQEAWEEVRRRMKTPGARIGEVLAAVRKRKCMWKVSPARFRRKWYQDQNKARKQGGVK